MSPSDEIAVSQLKSATTAARVQHLVTGFRCEVKGCFTQGEWYVTFNDLGFHWCGAHTTKRMHDNKFWEKQVKGSETKAK